MNFKVVTKVIIFSLVFVQGLSPLAAVDAYSQVPPSPKPFYRLDSKVVFSNPILKKGADQPRDLVEIARSLIMCGDYASSLSVEGKCLFEPTVSDPLDLVPFKLVAETQLIYLGYARDELSKIRAPWLPRLSLRFGQSGAYNFPTKDKILTLIRLLSKSINEIDSYARFPYTMWNFKGEVSKRSYSVTGPLLIATAYKNLVQCVERTRGVSSDGKVDLSNPGLRNLVVNCERAAYKEILAESYFGPNTLSPIIQPIAGRAYFPGDLVGVYSANGNPVNYIEDPKKTPYVAVGAKDVLTDITLNGSACGGGDVETYYSEADPAKRAKMAPPQGDCHAPKAVCMGTVAGSVQNPLDGYCSDGQNWGFLFDFTDRITRTVLRQREVGEKWDDWSNCREEPGKRELVNINSPKDKRTRKLVCSKVTT